jgi:hypothetical protein
MAHGSRTARAAETGIDEVFSVALGIREPPFIEKILALARREC